MSHMIRLNVHLIIQKRLDSKQRYHSLNVLNLCHFLVSASIIHPLVKWNTKNIVTSFFMTIVCFQAKSPAGVVTTGPAVTTMLTMTTSWTAWATPPSSSPSSPSTASRKIILSDRSAFKFSFRRK